MTACRSPPHPYTRTRRVSGVLAMIQEAETGRRMPPAEKKSPPLRTSTSKSGARESSRLAPASSRRKEGARSRSPAKKVGKKKARKRATGIKTATGRLAMRATDPDGKLGWNKNPKNEEVVNEKVKSMIDEKLSGNYQSVWAANQQSLSKAYQQAKAEASAGLTSIADGSAAAKAQSAVQSVATKAQQSQGQVVAPVSSSSSEGFAPF